MSTEHNPKSARERPLSMMIPKNTSGFATLRIPKKTNTLLTEPEQKQPITSVWKEFSAPNGRKYFYNPQTKETQWESPTSEDIETPVCTVLATVFSYDTNLKSWVPSESGNSTVAVLKKRDAYRIVVMSPTKKCLLNQNINTYFKFKKASETAVNVQTRTSTHCLTCQNSQMLSKLMMVLEEATENAKKATQKAIDSFKQNSAAQVEVGSLPAPLLGDQTAAEKSSETEKPFDLRELKAQTVGISLPLPVISPTHASSQPAESKLKLKEQIDHLTNKNQTLESQNHDLNRQLAWLKGENLENLDSMALINLQIELTNALLKVQTQLKTNIEQKK